MTNWLGCKCNDFREDENGHARCSLCGLRAPSNACMMKAENNEDRASACDATPSPLDATKERRMDEVTPLADTARKSDAGGRA